MSSAIPPSSSTPLRIRGCPAGHSEKAGAGLADLGHAVLDLAGLIPGVGAAFDAAKAAWYSADGDLADAGLSAAAAIPFGGWAATSAKLAGKAVKAAKAAEAGEEAAKTGETVAKDAASVSESAGDGPVVFRGRTHWTAEENDQLRRYVEACERARHDGALSETGRVSTSGELRREANKAAMAERLRAKAEGDPYQGQVGHAPDTTWTGRPDAYEWHDQTDRVNASLSRWCTPQETKPR